MQGRLGTGVIASVSTPMSIVNFNILVCIIVFFGWYLYYNLKTFFIEVEINGYATVTNVVISMSKAFNVDGVTQNNTTTRRNSCNSKTPSTIATSNLLQKKSVNINPPKKLTKRFFFVSK